MNPDELISPEGKVWTTSTATITPAGRTWINQVMSLANTATRYVCPKCFKGTLSAETDGQWYSTSIAACDQCDFRVTLDVLRAFSPAKWNEQVGNDPLRAQLSAQIGSRAFGVEKDPEPEPASLICLYCQKGTVVVPQFPVTVRNGGRYSKAGRVTVDLDGLMAECDNCGCQYGVELLKETTPERWDAVRTGADPTVKLERCWNIKDQRPEVVLHSTP